MYHPHYHMGSLEVLLNERDELIRILMIVNSLIKMHAKNLEKNGVDPETFIRNFYDKKFNGD